jgi:thiamine-phosphate pyrophosphorylase
MTLPRVYPILDTETAVRRGVGVVEAATQILEGGVGILQFRHKAFWSREIFEMLEQVAEMCQACGVPLVVNDRADMARLVDAGLHLGQDDLPPSAARGILGEGVLGFSTHNEAQLRAAESEPADYLALGPIFGTVSKVNPDPVVGLDGLRQWRPLTRRPLVAIGGITRENAQLVLEAGADSVAVIGDLFPGDLHLEDSDIAARVREWMRIR